ncbi:MAG: hypothetical protein GC161_16735 [Planctomycetaceae bacterium]|nr:hypothetical protein [Planctomycetaceae bacterium]
MPEDAPVPSVRAATGHAEVSSFGVSPEPEAGTVALVEAPPAPVLKLVDELSGLPVPGAWAKVLWTRDTSYASAWNEVPLVADDSGSAFELPQLEPTALYNVGALVGGDQHAPQWKYPLWYTNERFQSAELSLLRGGGVSLDVRADQSLPAFLTWQQVPRPERVEWTTEWPVLATGQLVVPVHSYEPVTLTISASELGLDGSLEVPLPPEGVVPFGALFLESKRLVDVRVLRSSLEPAPSLDVIFSGNGSGAAERELQTDERGVLRCFEEDLREREILANVLFQKIPPTSVQLDTEGEGATIVFPLSLMTLEIEGIAGDQVDEVRLRPLDAAMQPKNESFVTATSASKPRRLVQEGVGLYVVVDMESGRRLGAVVPSEAVVGDFTVRVEEQPATLGSLRLDRTGLELGPDDRLRLRVWHKQVTSSTTILRAEQGEWTFGSLFPGEYSVVVEAEQGYSFAVPSTVAVTVDPGMTTDVPFVWQRGGRLRLELRDESADGTPPTEWSARLRDSTGQWRELRFLHQTQFGRTKSATITSGAPATVEGIFPAGPALLELRALPSATIATEHPIEIRPGETVSIELTP